MLSLEWYYDIFPYVDYFIPNAMEAMKITGADTPGTSIGNASGDI